jgi:hypothetical protein
METVFATNAILAGLTVGGVGLAALAVGRLAGRAAVSRPWHVAAIAAAVLAVWLSATAALAETGVLGDSTARPPRVPLLALTALATFVLVGRTKVFGRLMTAVPFWLPVAVQTFRVVVEYALWRLYLEGRAPVQVTFEGWNFDALAGLSAPLVAAGVASGRVGPRGVLAWNLFGLGMLGTAVFAVVTSAPGPFRLDWPGEPFTAVATWPVVWIPALLAPAAVFLHVVSIRQSLARLAAGGRAISGGTLEGSSS